MNIKNVKRSIQLMFIGVIFEVIGLIAVAGVRFNVPALSFFGIAAIVGLILELIAVIRVHRENTKYRYSFCCLIAALVLTIVGYIFIFTGVAALCTIAVYLLIAMYVCEIGSTYYFIEGSTIVLEEAQKKDLSLFGHRLKFAYIGAVAIAVVIDILLSIPAIANINALAVILVCVRIVVHVAALVAYLIFLYRAYKRL